MKKTSKISNRKKGKRHKAARISKKKKMTRAKSKR